MYVGHEIYGENSVLEIFVSLMVWMDLVCSFLTITPIRCGLG